MSKRWSIIALAAGVMLIGAACGGGTTSSGDGGGSGGGGTTGTQPPTANMKPPTSIGTGEGELDVIAWEGYTQPLWVKPFETQTGCQVKAKYAGSSDQMVSLMSGGGGGQYDLVSASGDASLRLIYGGDVKPVNVALVPDWQNFFTELQSPPHNTINDIHYGSRCSGAEHPDVQHAGLHHGSGQLELDLRLANTGKITVPDNDQIADAALYLSKTSPTWDLRSLRADEPQFDAAISLLKQQRP
jgi:putative spermidine/putrescine transport system substrate-binding protein